MNKSLIGVVVGVIVIVAAVFFLNNDATAPTTEEANNTPQVTATPTPTPTATTTPDAAVNMDIDVLAPKTVEIAVTESVFTPSAVTIKLGDTVKFVNKGTEEVQPASGPHPFHTNYPEFVAPEPIPVGQSWSFTFTKAGKWGFHNHLNPEYFGSVTVE